MVDVSAEMQRLEKRLVKMEGEYKGIRARLDSPKVGDSYKFLNSTSISNTIQ